MKKRRLRKGIRRFLKISAYIVFALFADVGLLCTALGNQERAFWILIVLACLGFNAMLYVVIDDKKCEK